MLESHACGAAPLFRQSWAITPSYDFGQSFGAFFPVALINIFLRELRVFPAQPAKPADRHTGIIFDLDGTLVDTVVPGWVATISM
ncbi:hypothetical protein [Dyella acidisoli]|uniref:HAD family hydrolase n=1 Tax=Dyella acidisoli TaxID=1867834 RepID=A0ABQ5XPB0_9GAMM|nr:hypothetical protein [Dyella acidisoli]GLQ93524.1 hypothetical protein GCM10007901_24750 [Dyella acidisoli]